jgi:hypothetical protein
MWDERKQNMLKASWLPLAVAVFFGGCTTVSLKDYTLDQINSVEEYRVDATLDCLTTVAAHPDTLPSFGLLASGVTHVQDTGSVNSITTWTRALKGFATESFGLSASRSPIGQWSVDPVASYSQLDALRAACRWAVFGPEAAWNESPGLLLDPAVYYSPQEPRFNVAWRLERLPRNWVHVGRKSDVPKCAAYEAHCGDVYIWVMPQEKWCFSEFILVMHDIATNNPDAGVLSEPLLVTITRTFPINGRPTSCYGASILENPNSLSFVEYRVVRPEYRQRIEEKLAQAHDEGKCVRISEAQWIEATYAYNGNRTSSKAASAGQGSPAPASQLRREIPVPPTRLNTMGLLLGPTVLRAPQPGPTKPVPSPPDGVQKNP